MFLRNHDNTLVAMYVCTPGRGYNGYADYNANALPSNSYFDDSNVEGGDGHCNLRTTEGGYQDIYYAGTMYYASSSHFTGIHVPASLGVPSICLGTGDTPVTYEDYKLSGAVIPNILVQQSRKVKYDTATGKWVVTLIATYYNSTSSEITIKEWGIWRYVKGNNPATSGYSNNSQYVALTFREVLNAPIVIEAGTTATLTFSLDVPMPNHP